MPRSRSSKNLSLRENSAPVRDNGRRGGALIEFVIVLPVMFIVILGSVDICNTIFVKQFLTEVSYQGALQGADSGLSETELKASIQAYLTARDIGTATVTTRGTDGTPFDDLVRGEMFEVIVNLPSADRESSPVIIPYVNLDARSVGLRQ